MNKTIGINNLILKVLVTAPKQSDKITNFFCNYVDENREKRCQEAGLVMKK